MDFLIKFIAISFIIFLIIGICYVYYLIICKLSLILGRKFREKKSKREWEGYKYKQNNSEIKEGKYWKKYHELQEQIRKEKHLYPLNQLEEFCNERCLIGSNTNHEVCVKYKILRMFDEEYQSYNWFVLCQPLNFSGLFRCVFCGAGDDGYYNCKKCIREIIQNLQEENEDFDDEIISGEIEDEFLTVENGEWKIKEE